MASLIPIFYPSTDNDIDDWSEIFLEFVDESLGRFQSTAVVEITRQKHPSPLKASAEKDKQRQLSLVAVSVAATPSQPTAIFRAFFLIEDFNNILTRPTKHIALNTLCCVYIRF